MHEVGNAENCEDDHADADVDNDADVEAEIRDGENPGMPNQVEQLMQAQMDLMETSFKRTPNKTKRHFQTDFRFPEAGLLQSGRGSRGVIYFLKAMTNSFQTLISKVFPPYASSNLCEFII